jgi:hypothetical protein
MRIDSSPQIYICSFYSDKFQYKFAAQRLRKQIDKISIIQKSYIYSEKKFFKLIADKYRNMLELFISEKTSYGFAWFAWKPIIILETLKLIPENSILLYLDIGCDLKNNDEYWNDIQTRIKSSKLITSYARGAGFNRYGEKELTWTKSEVLKVLKINESDKNSPQYHATWIMMINNKNNRDLIHEWFHYCTLNNFSLVRPSDEFRSGKRNTYDQSVFSCLLKMNSIKPLIANKNDMSIISASRNLSIFPFFESNFVFRAIKYIERSIIKIMNFYCYNKTPKELN